ncbi:hypothetical protein AVEN_248495-1 [Araneus ventricosus]|uniref:Uncharacterized protein n=1 Tax=Araneus ventricosus TaxID=182803 RepID=A0A4Y2E1C2_ARAVE|nr:hypothetical protein AVEN_248495-1 [Araneus ventricosus]
MIIYILHSHKWIGKEPTPKRPIRKDVRPLVGLWGVISGHTKFAWKYEKDRCGSSDTEVGELTELPTRPGVSRGRSRWSSDKVSTSRSDSKVPDTKLDSTEDPTCIGPIEC